MTSSTNFSIEYSETSTLKLSPFVRTHTHFQVGKIWFENRPATTTATSMEEIKRCLPEKWGIKRISRSKLLYDEFSMWILADLPWEITQKWENNKTNFCVIDFIEITEFWGRFYPTLASSCEWYGGEGGKVGGVRVSWLACISRRIMFETNGDWNNDDEVFKWLSPEWVSGGVGIEEASAGKLAQNRFLRVLINPPIYCLHQKRQLS